MVCFSWELISSCMLWLSFCHSLSWRMGWSSIFPQVLGPPGPQSPLIQLLTLRPIYNHDIVNDVFWFSIKTFGIIMLMLLPRGINPRIRIDILLHTGWYKLIVLSFINMFIALALVYGGVFGPGGSVDTALTARLEVLSRR